METLKKMTEEKTSSILIGAGYHEGLNDFADQIADEIGLETTEAIEEIVAVLSQVISKEYGTFELVRNAKRSAREIEFKIKWVPLLKEAGYTVTKTNAGTYRIVNSKGSTFTVYPKKPTIHVHRPSKYHRGNFWKTLKKVFAL